MEERQPQPGPSGCNAQPLAGVGPTDEVGFARYVHQPEASAQRARKAVLRLRWARNHYLNLIWFLELAWTRLEYYHQDICELARSVEKEHFTHSDTAWALSDLDKELRKRTKECSDSLYQIVPRVKSAQMEIGWALERMEPGEVTDGDYERTEQVLVMLPTQPVSHKLVHNILRVFARIRRGSSHQKPLSDDAAGALLPGESLNTSDRETKPTVKFSEKQSKDAAVPSGVERDGETMANVDERNSETTSDVKKATFSLYYVTHKLWKQHGVLWKTLLQLVKNLHEKETGRTRLQATAVGRGATRMQVVELMNAALAVEAELRAAMLEIARQAQQLSRFGAETWPGQPAAASFLTRAVRRPPPAWSLCDLLCCVRRC